MKILRRVILSIIILIVLIFIFHNITNNISKYTGLSVLNNKDLTNCILKNNIKIYINDKNSSQFINNLPLKDYLNNMEVLNCKDIKTCKKEGIVINNFTYPLNTNFEELKTIINC